MARKKFNFKSSGKLSTAKDIIEPVITSLPIGIKTPLEYSAGKHKENFYKMHFDPASQIKDNFRNLLLTNFGERLGNGGLGANLKSLLYDATNVESIEVEANRRIMLTASKSLPMIQVRDIKINFLGLDSETKDVENSPKYDIANSVSLSAMKVFIKYDIPRLTVTNQAIEVIMAIGG